MVRLTSSSISHIIRVFCRFPLVPRSRNASSIALHTGIIPSPGTHASRGTASAHRLGLKNPPTNKLNPNRPSFMAGMYARSLMWGCSNISWDPTTHTFHFLGLQTKAHHKHGQSHISCCFNVQMQGIDEMKNKQHKLTHWPVDKQQLAHWASPWIDYIKYATKIIW